MSHRASAAPEHTECSAGAAGRAALALTVRCWNFNNLKLTKDQPERKREAVKNPWCFNFLQSGQMSDISNLSNDPHTTFSPTISPNSSFNSSVIMEGTDFFHRALV